MWITEARLEYFNCSRNWSILCISHNETKENSGCYFRKWWPSKWTKILKCLTEGLGFKRAIQTNSEKKFSYFLLFVGFVRCSFQLALFRYKSNWASFFYKINSSWSQTAFWDANCKTLQDNRIVPEKTNWISIYTECRMASRVNQKGCEYGPCPV